MRVQADDKFKDYAPRGTGKYKTTVGKHTLCKECEALNAKAKRLFSQESRTVEDEKYLDICSKLYLQWTAMGGRVCGAYGAHVLGTEVKKTIEPKKTLMSLAESLLDSTSVDNYLVALQKFLSESDWTEEPDVYNDRLDEIRSQIVDRPGGAVQPQYQTLYNKCLDKCAEYEDNYVWE